jgi:multiple sugar transport system substrate-binding protein
VVITRRAKGLFVLLALLCAAACGASDGNRGSSGVVRVQAWAHSGQDAERRVVQAQVDRFNASHTGVAVDLTLLPEGSYNQQVQAAALAGDLPDVLELDGPFVAAYAWQGHLQPLDSLIPDSVLSRLLPSIVTQGTYRGRLWALGAYDSGLGLFARRSILRDAGVRVPSGPEDAWSVEEMERWMASLAQRDEDGEVLDLHLNYPGEWYTYAFQPTLRSAGGGIVDMEDDRSEGFLDSRASVSALTHVQTWIERGWVDPNLDDAAFVEGRVALSWSGHWDYQRYRDAWGEDLEVLPLPDFGTGTRTGQGSWVWAVTHRSQVPGRAVEWIRFLLSEREVTAMSDANSAVPALRSVADASTLYGPDGPLRLLFDQLGAGWAVPRPRTPAYPVVTSAFQDAFDAIRTGADVRSTLTNAAGIIDREIADNRRYPASADVP